MLFLLWLFITVVPPLYSEVRLSDRWINQGEIWVEWTKSFLSCGYEEISQRDATEALEAAQFKIIKECMLINSIPKLTRFSSFSPKDLSEIFEIGELTYFSYLLFACYCIKCKTTFANLKGEKAAQSVQIFQKFR